MTSSLMTGLQFKILLVELKTHMVMVEAQFPLIR